jgi:hypothetical protein
MLNQHGILKEELRKVGNALKKKYVVLRKEVAKTIEVFDNDHIPVFPYEVCFGLFRQVAETGSLSCSMAFLPFLQTIINLGFSNAEMSREILNLLIHTRSIPRFEGLENEVRVQEILAILVSKNCIELKNMAFTLSFFNAVLSLHNSKSRELWLKSATILYQALVLLLNCCNNSPSPDHQTALATFTGSLVGIVK